LQKGGARSGKALLRKVSNHETSDAARPGSGLPAGVTSGTIGRVYGDGPNPIAELDDAGRLRKYFVYF
jgi:hypothetical protein